MVDDTTSKKTQMRMYVLEQLLKKPSFNVMSNIDNVLELPSPKFQDSNQLSSAKSHGLKKRSFKPVKLFALDIEIVTIPGKNVNEKLISIKKIFYQVDDFEGAFTPSKFPEIIKFSFTSELSLNKTKELMIHGKILVNNNIRKLGIHSNQEIIVKKIPVDLPRSAVESVFFKFGKIMSIKMQLIGLWQKALVEFDSLEVASLVVSKWDQHRALLYTLPIGITAHDLSGLLDSYGKKTCFIGCNPSSYVHNRCAVICFINETFKLAAIRSVPVFKGTSLQWTGFSLACCTKCKQFGYISNVCSSDGISEIHKKWVVTDQDLVSGILVKLGSLELMHLAVASGVSLSKIPVTVVPDLDLDMVLDGKSMVYTSSSLVVNDIATTISPSSSKILTTKIGGLESKIMALEVLVESVLEKLDHLCSGLSLLVLPVEF
ncbi:hypothetical protein G9A89_006476 [Geosiphon pyriformis]|nr:hypothetical protein G9A89_006476 [Geosiphon pyriformis]